MIRIVSGARRQAAGRLQCQRAARRAPRIIRASGGTRCVASSSSPRYLIIAVLIVSAAGLSAQWLKHPDPRVPRTADGKPNLTAPAPRLPDGKPDLNGLWNATDGRFLTNISRRAGVDAAVSTVGEDALRASARRTRDATARRASACRTAIPDAMLVPSYPWKIVQTPGLMVILFENFTDFRQIFTDGRSHPAERGPTWFGYSDRPLRRRHVRRRDRRLQREDVAGRWRASAERKHDNHRAVPAEGLRPPRDRVHVRRSEDLHASRGASPCRSSCCPTRRSSRTCARTNGTSSG